MPGCATCPESEQTGGSVTSQNLKSLPFGLFRLPCGRPRSGPESDSRDGTPRRPAARPAGDACRDRSPADKQSKLGFSHGESKRLALGGCVRASSQQHAQSSGWFRSRESLGRELTAKLRYSRRPLSASHPPTLKRRVARPARTPVAHVAASSFQYLSLFLLF